MGQVACHSRLMCIRYVLNQYTSHTLMIVMEYDAQITHNMPAHRPTHDDSTRIHTHPTSSQCVSRVTNTRFEHARGAVRPPACERAAARLLVRQQRVGERWRRVDGRGGRHAGQHVLRGSLCPWAVARSGVWSVTVACAARSRSAGQLADESTPAGPAAASERLREWSTTRVSTRELTCWGVMGSPHGCTRKIARSATQRTRVALGRRGLRLARPLVRKLVRLPVGAAAGQLAP